MSEDYAWAVAHVITGQMGGTIHCSICGAGRCELVTGILRPSYMGISPGEEAAIDMQRLKKAQETIITALDDPDWIFRHLFDDEGNVL